MKKHQLAEKLQCFQEYSKWPILTKGRLYAKFPKLVVLMADLQKANKNRKYLTDFDLIGMDGAELILVCVLIPKSIKLMSSTYWPDQ